MRERLGPDAVDGSGEDAVRDRGVARLQRPQRLRQCPDRRGRVEDDLCRTTRPPVTLAVAGVEQYGSPSSDTSYCACAGYGNNDSLQTLVAMQPIHHEHSLHDTRDLMAHWWLQSR